MEARTQFVRLVPDEAVNTCFGERSMIAQPVILFCFGWVILETSLYTRNPRDTGSKLMR
jgi:hypothetical protein